MTSYQQQSLRLARDTFRRYGHHHELKGDQVKAAANFSLADQMELALKEETPANVLNEPEELTRI